MRATCTRNPEHKKFITSVHVAEEWEVDEEGNWLRTIDSVEVTHKPDPDNTWTCSICGAPAKVERPGI